MNYYSFHIGDYLSATAHLTLLEHGAYRRLLDVYYINEAPLPADIQKVHRLTGARTKEEKEAVNSVLEEFFVSSDIGYQHSRCDHEIGICNKNRTNGSKGGRPPKTNNPNETQAEPKAEPNNNPNETQAESPPSPHHPITPSPKKNTTPPAAFDPRAEILRLGVDEQVADDFLKLRKKKRAEVTATALRGIAGEAAKAGITVNDAMATCCKNGWQGFEASWVAGKARASPTQSRDEGRRQVLEILTGAGKNELRIERDITGEAVRLAG